MNEKGNATLLGLTLIVLLSSFLLLTFKKRKNEFKVIQAKQELLLCAKKINGETKNIISFIKITNKYLKLLKIAKFTSLFIPGIGVVGKAGIKTAQKNLKKIQQLRYVSYVKKTLSTPHKMCQSFKSLYKTPLKTISLYQLKRNQFDQAIFRGKTWNYIVFNQYFIIKNKFQLNGKSQSQLIKKVNPLSALYSF